MSDTATNYEGGLATLANSADNTEDINTIIKLQQSEWSFLKKSFDVENTTLVPASVFSSTNLMTKNFDRATALYEKLVVN